MRRLASLLLLAIVAASGCATARFRQPVADFQDGISKTAAVVSVYYAEVNAFERDLYFQELEADPELTVATNIAGKPTPLAGVLPAASIKARTDAIELLGVYGKRLAALAGSTLPAETAATVSAMGASFSSLQQTFAGLGGNDSTAASYTQPISSLVAIVTQGILENQRDAMLTDAIKKGGPVVNDIITLIETDLRTVIGPLRMTGTQQTLANLIISYNTRRKAMTPDARRKALDEIRRAQDRYDAAVLFNPTDLLQGLRDAHAALVKYATSRRSDMDAAELTATLDVFVSRADAAAKEVARIRDLQGGDK